MPQSLIQRIFLSLDRPSRRVGTLKLIGSTYDPRCNSIDLISWITSICSINAVARRIRRSKPGQSFIMTGIEGSGAVTSRRIAEISQHRSEEHTSELQSLRHLVCRL